MPDITSANATLILSAPDAIGVPTPIQGFSTDDIFSTTRVKPVETMMGIDGTLSAGFLYTEKPMEIVLMAGSPSTYFFEAVQATQEAGVFAVELSGVLTLPSLGKAYQLIQGYLTGYPPTSDGKKVMQPVRYELTWQNIQAMPIGQAG
jgi:hypothetical protein